MSISCSFSVAKCEYFMVLQTVRLMDDCFWSGGFFGVVIGLAFNICIC